MAVYLSKMAATMVGSRRLLKVIYNVHADSYMYILKFCASFVLHTILCKLSNGPGHAKMWLMSYANHKGADQLAHLQSDQHLC